MKRKTELDGIRCKITKITFSNKDVYFVYNNALSVHYWYLVKSKENREFETKYNVVPYSVQTISLSPQYNKLK